VAERRPDERVTQRRLEDETSSSDEPDEDPVPTESDPALPEEPPTPPVAKPPLHLEGPSDAGLRQRQDAWLAERARHEAYRRTRRAEDPGDAPGRR
jgi:hypothetical protein